MKQLIVGIDIGTHLTRVTISAATRENPVPQIIGFGQAESKGLRHGYIVNPQDATNSIKQAVLNAEENTSVKIKKAIVSIGGISLSSEYAVGSAIISRADKEISPIDISNAINDSEQNLVLTNKRILHRVPVAYKIDGKLISARPDGLKGIKLEAKVLFVTCLSQHLDDLLSAVTNAGIEVLDVVASPFAASSVTLSSKQRTVGSVLVDIGSETVSIVVFENDIPLTLQVFGIGGAEITKDIALGFKIPYDEAEGIKTGSIMSDLSRKKLDEIIQARLADIFELVDAHLKKNKCSGLLAGGAVIMGGGAQYPYIEQLGKDILRLPVKLADPDIWGSSKNRLRDSSWFISAGLCAGMFGSGVDMEVDNTSFIQTIKKLWKNIVHQLMP